MPAAIRPLLARALPAGIVGPQVGQYTSFKPFLVNGAAYGGLVGTAADAAKLAAAHAASATDAHPVLGQGDLEEIRTTSSQGRRFDHGIAGSANPLMHSEALPLSTAEVAHKVAVPGLNETLEITAQHEFLHQPPKDSERRVELDPVHHGGGTGGVLAELMDVPEPPERPLHLFIDKVARDLHCGDSARHPEWNTEVPGPPGYLFAQGDQTRRDTGNGFLAGPRHRCGVRVDAPGQVEQDLPGHAGPRCAFKANGHCPSIAVRESRLGVPVLGALDGRLGWAVLSAIAAHAPQMLRAAAYPCCERLYLL
jgi:hypothetical protein